MCEGVGGSSAGVPMGGGGGDFARRAAKPWGAGGAEADGELDGGVGGRPSEATVVYGSS